MRTSWEDPTTKLRMIITGVDFLRMSSACFRTRMPHAAGHICLRETRFQAQVAHLFDISVCTWEVYWDDLNSIVKFDSVSIHTTSLIGGTVQASCILLWKGRRNCMEFTKQQCLNSADQYIKISLQKWGFPKKICEIFYDRLHHEIRLCSEYIIKNFEIIFQVVLFTLDK